MKELLGGQTISCDIHDVGSGQEACWGKGLHIHKRMPNSHGSAEIIILLDSHQEMSIKTKGKANIQNILKKEIKKAFSNRNKRNEFVDDLIKEIGKLYN